MSIFQSLGTPITIDRKKKEVIIQGVGKTGFKQPKHCLDAGNSGTGIRLITGFLAGQPFTSCITGDASIQQRPMKRILTPLKQMGASITGNTSEKNQEIYPPLTIVPSKEIIPLNYTLPVASAQVKSALLLCSLYSEERSTIIEPEKCRDHTERLLSFYGADIHVNGKEITCSGKNRLINPNSAPLVIPSDVSSAAFFIVLGLINQQSSLRLKNIGLNPTRAQILDVLKDMGAKISIQQDKSSTIEPYGDLLVETSELSNITLEGDIIPFIIDEIPILAIAALFAKGTLTVKNAEELRVKESDRIETIATMVKQFGGSITTTKDGFSLTGPITTTRASIQTKGDHRIAMAAIIGAISSGVTITLDDSDCINTSFPNFFNILQSLSHETHDNLHLQ